MVTTTVEHPSVAEVVNALEEDGLRVTRVPVDAQGRLDARAVVEAVTPETILVSVMHVQNETGAVFPVQAIARQAKQKNRVLKVHSDGVQAFGKLPAPEAVDLYSVSAHKLHGPKGAGALLQRKGARLIAQQRGGGQERGLRSGTENVPALVGFGVAAELAREARAAWTASARQLGDRLRQGVTALGGVLNSPDDAAPWIVNVSFPGLAAEPLLHALEERGVYVSTGAACASRKREHSPVLRAMNLSQERLASALRLSLSRLSSAEQVEAALVALEAALEARRAAT
jgi:cysteine desulfurase